MEDINEKFFVLGVPKFQRSGNNHYFYFVDKVKKNTYIRRIIEKENKIFT